MGELTPYIAVADARAAIAWYCEVLGAVQSRPPILMPDGRVGHAELRLSDSDLFLSDAHAEIGVVAPSGRDNDVTLHLLVDDVDGLLSRATGRGATVDRAPADSEHGRIAVIRDPFGHRWMLNQPASG